MKNSHSLIKITILLLLLILVLSGCVSKSNYEEVTSKVVELKSDLDNVIDENEALAEELEALKKELDDIKNGPSNLLSQAKKFLEEKNYNKVIETTSTLHNKFNGIPEDVEGQALAKKAQEKIDEQIRLEKEEEERIAAENLKTARDKAREIIRVTKVSKSNPNSAGGVDLFIGYKNMSEKIIKYATFTIVPYNKVGDRATCDIRGNSTFYAKDEGPHKKGEGISGNYNWYWENAWYNWSIDKLELTEIDIIYMDGTSVKVSGEDLEHVRY